MGTSKPRASPRLVWVAILTLSAGGSALAENIDPGNNGSKYAGSENLRADANIKAAALANGQCGLSDGSKAGDRRLPTVEEWEAINMISCYPFPGGPTIPDKTGTACYLTGIQWGINVQSNVYWSSSTNTASPSNAWAWDLFSREVNGGSKTFNLYVWPVRVSR